MIEVLIATAMTLMIMLALAQMFKMTSEGISAGRARLTGSDQLRSVTSLLRSDLQGLTVSTTTHPQSTKSPLGYFMYYDGPISEFTAMLFNYLPTGKEEEDKFSGGRWSDIDDVLMFTAKARDGQWFYGRVPLALMKIHSGVDPKFIQINDWYTDVTIASEYAEIAWFMRPLNSVGMLNPPGASNDVNDSIPVVDLDGDLIPDPDGMPDRIALCRRVLLIRPDLNLALPIDNNIPGDPRITASPTAVDANAPDTYRYQMRYAHQRTDLSVRKLWDPSNNRFVLKTNSLADLQRPENRFAHFSLPYNDPTYGLVSSLPMLALTNEASSSGNYLTMTNLAMKGVQPNNDRGFIPAEFCRANLILNSDGSTTYQFTQEEFVASNVVGFDIRGYDNSAVQLYSQGSDGIFGINNLPAEAGWPGTDDLVVGPSDPGYAVMLEKGPIIPANSGTFVDLSWGTRVLNQLKNASRNTHVLSTNNSTVWASALSGLEPITGGTIDSLVRSGRFSTLFSVNQPVFDTFTDYYEADGNVQLNGISTNGMIPYGGSASSDNSFPDKGIDGIDNNSNGVIDEEAERDTSPPFRYALPAIQIRVRVQDPTAGSLQELAIVHNIQGS